MAIVKPETEWPAYEVKARRIEDLKTYDRNARTHSAEHIVAYSRC